MIRSKSLSALAALLCAAALTLAACTADGYEMPDEPVSSGDTQSEQPIATEEKETTASQSKADEEKSETKTTANAFKAETTTKAAETTAKETEPAKTTAETAPNTTTAPETTPAPLWTETETVGIMYINTDGIYSRAQALQGSAKVAQYGLNDAVNVIARTDTEYFKLDNGAFIHASYLSVQKTEITTAAATTAATITAAPVTTTTTAAPVTEPPAETNSSTWGQYGQRNNTQSELDFIAKTFDLLNAERAKEGLSPFQHLDTLDTVAAIRAWELTVEYRSDHVRPDGTSCTTAFNQNGIIYGAWGENVAAGQQTPEAVVEAWMNSPPHRASILSDYTHVGVGYYYSENDSQNFYHFWTLEFYKY